MSFLSDIHFEIESNHDLKQQKEFRVAYLTIISFLKFVDNGSNFTEKYLKDRFSHRNNFRIVLEKLISHSILKKSDDGTYILDMESKNLISPVFDNSMFIANLSENKNTTNNAKNFLYN